MFLCQIFFPSLGSRLPLIVTLSPKLWYLPFQNPNSPRRSKSLKHKNGKWDWNNGSNSSYVFCDLLLEGGGWGAWGVEGGPMILLSPPLPLWLFSGFSVCTSASNTLPLLFSSSGELSNSDPFKVSRGCPLISFCRLGGI